jgi:hypothetical protein
VNVLLFLLCAGGLAAQPIEIQGLGSAAPLNGIWKQKLGDNPAWADPAFDDSAWAAISMPRPATPGARGITWHRIHLSLPESSDPLFVMIGPLFPAYEIYANGRAIGRFGGPLGNPRGQLYSKPAIFPLPRERRIVLAIRSEDTLLVYGAQSSSAESSQSWVGVQSVLTEKASTWRQRRLDRNEVLRAIAVILLTGSAFFMLMSLVRRRDYEYFWIAVYLSGNAVFRLVQAVPEWLGDPDRWTAQCFSRAVLTPVAISLVFFCRAVFRERANAIVWLGLAVSVLVLFLNLPGPSDWARRTAPAFWAWSAVLYNVGELAIYAPFAWRARHRTENFWPVHFGFGTYLFGNFLFYSIFSRDGGGAGDQMPLLAIVLRSLVVVFAGGMAIYLSQRSARQDQEQGRLLQEMTAAREVQALLVPARSKPGVEAVYLPAAEVGGDFYQILDRQDGAWMLLTGDVSGKGLKAAMLVSVVIGALRQSRETSPAALLADLNRVLHGQTGGGFVTAVCACFHADGRVTMANAGHLAPYVDGRELALEPGLPLGLAPDVAYEQAAVEGQQFTFVTDGVVEAASADGELFGFDRTREISAKSAREIAQAAKHWGQNDDITVVTVRRTGA